MAKKVARNTEPATWQDRWAALRHIPPLLAMVFETGRALALASIFLRLLKSLIPVATLWIGKLIFDQIARHLTGRAPDLSRLWWLVGAELLLAVTNDFIGRGISLCDSLLGDRFTNVISVRLMQHADRLDLALFEDPAFYDKLERARRQTSGRLGLLAALSGMAQECVTLASLTVGLIVFSPWLMLLLVVAVVPSFLGETHFAGLAYSLLYKKTPERRELDYVRMLGASIQSAKEVKIFGLGPYLMERYRVAADRFYEENRKLAIRRAGVGGLLNLIGTAGYYGAYIVILQRTLNGALSLGDLTFLSGAFSRSRNLIESLLGSITNITDQALYLTDLYDFFAMEPGMKESANPVPAPRPIRSGFEFQNVSFCYPGSNHYVLKNISFRLQADERIALIGENGSGKTTLVKLLSRLYDPQDGRILLDGVDLREYSTEDLRREVGVIFQDYMRYDMLVKENIGFGRIQEIGNADRILQAARKSLADAVVEKLPNHFDQMLGRRFEGGSDLSGGQWQKIALARAYMRDAQLLILDEPTASLDARAEYEVFLRFADLTNGKMAVLISHRFSTVRMADRILVLENGAILEEGTHSQLVARRGRYAELFELQAAGYR